MNGRFVGLALVIAGVVIANFGILVPPIESYYQYMGCFGNLLGPCSLPTTYFDILFFSGVGVTVVGILIMLRARRQETAWLVKP